MLPKITVKYSVIEQFCTRHSASSGSYVYMIVITYLTRKYLFTEII